MNMLISQSMVAVCFIIASLQCTGPAEIPPSMPMPKCSASPNGRPCELRDETIYNGSDASRNIEILMDLSELTTVLNSSNNLQILGNNGRIIIANGEVIVGDYHAIEYRKRWTIQISSFIDLNVNQTLRCILKYRVNVKYRTHTDEYIFRLSFSKDNLVFSTSEAAWFPLPPTLPPTSPPTLPPTSPPTLSPTSPPTDPPNLECLITTPEPERDCVSSQEFHQAKSHQNDINNQILRLLQATLALDVIIIFLFIISIIIIIKYNYPKIKSWCARYSEVQQEVPESSDGQAISNNTQPSVHLQVLRTAATPVDESPDREQD